MQNYRNACPHPFRAGIKFQNLEDLRRAVADAENTARQYGYTAEEILFSDEFMLSLVSDKLSDGSVVLNGTIAIATADSQLIEHVNTMRKQMRAVITKASTP